MNLLYIWNKVLKKLQGAAVLNSDIDRSSKVEAGSHVVNSRMDRYSFCGYDCKIINCQIGAFCSIADGVIIGGARHPMEWVSTSPVFYCGRNSVRKKFSEFKRTETPRTIIGNDVWIGDRAIIKAGVTIGDGVVIGMGSVVTTDIPSYTIVAGVPARRLRNRFPVEIVEALKASEWWNYSDERLAEVSKYIQEPDLFIKVINSKEKTST